MLLEPPVPLQLVAATPLMRSVAPGVHPEPVCIVGWRAR
jgi:hypothetical protein